MTFQEISTTIQYIEYISTTIDASQLLRCDARERRARDHRRGGGGGGGGGTKMPRAVPFPFRRGRHGRSIVYTVPPRGHSEREFSKASQLCCRNRGAARRSPVLSTGRKVDGFAHRVLAFSNTEFRPESGRDRVANYWQSTRKTDGPSIKFW